MTTIVGEVEVCPVCATPIDPENHASNPTTGTKYCSGECWAEDNL